MSQTMEQSSIREEPEEQDKKQKSRRPANTAFRQQRLKAWQPILTPKTVLPLFFAFGVIFAPLGGALLYASAKVKEISLDYTDCDQAPSCPNYERMPEGRVEQYFSNSTDASDQPMWCRDFTDVGYGVDNALTVNTSTCHVQFYLPDTLDPPVLFYYRLTNFYQNHRRYVKSFDQAQLQGEARSNSSIDGSDCEPLQVDEETGKAYYPCGLIANSLFNDTFFPPVLLQTQGDNAPNVTYNMTSDGIAWDSDQALYGKSDYDLSAVVPPRNWRERYPTYNESFPFPDLANDEAFQVWMRTAGLPTFAKLALRNDNETMQQGRYEVTVYDYFPVGVYDGTKSIFISTRTVMGGRNPFLGIAYVVVGGLCILLGALFTVTQLVRPRKLGDHSYLTWNTDQPSTATTTGRAPRPGEGA